MDCTHFKKKRSLTVLTSFFFFQFSTTLFKHICDMQVLFLRPFVHQPCRTCSARLQPWAQPNRHFVVVLRTWPVTSLWVWWPNLRFVLLPGWNDAHVWPERCCYSKRVSTPTAARQPALTVLSSAAFVLIVLFVCLFAFLDTRWCAPLRFLPPAYSISSRMLAQTPMSPYMSPISTYQVLKSAQTPVFFHCWYSRHT